MAEVDRRAVPESDAAFGDRHQAGEHPRRQQRWEALGPGHVVLDQILFDASEYVDLQASDHRAPEDRSYTHQMAVVRRDQFSAAQILMRWTIYFDAADGNRENRLNRFDIPAPTGCTKSCYFLPYCFARQAEDREGRTKLDSILWANDATV